MTDSRTACQDAFAAVDSKGRCVRPGRILFTCEQIHTRIDELAGEIVHTYTAHHVPDLTLVAILTGSMVFLADLIRAIPHPIRIGTMIVTNYAGPTTDPRGPELICDLQANVAGRDVLIVDDILDTGQTLKHVVQRLTARQPRSIRTCVMLEKQVTGPRAIQADFVGFRTPNEFVIGYGLDYDNLFRNYPGIAVLDKS